MANSGSSSDLRTLIVSDWEIGFQKVEFTKLQQKELGPRLAAAKANTDRILERKPVVFELTQADAVNVAKKMKGLGAIVTIKE